MRKIILCSVAVVVACAGDGRAAGVIDPKAAEVVQAARKATGTPAAVRLEVRTVGGYELARGVPKLSGRSTILFAAGTPSRLSGQLKAVDGTVYEVVVGDDEGSVLSSNGEIKKLPPRAYLPKGVMLDAYLTAPWFVNPDRLDQLTKKGSLVYAGRSDVGGEACDLVVHVTDDSRPTAQLIRTEYLWFSTRTHLLQSIQLFSIHEGSASPTDRRVLSKIELLPEVPKGAFDLKPTAGDTKALPNPEVAEGHGDEVQALVGKPIPDAELVDYPSVPTTLHKVLGVGSGGASDSLTLLTFWATWCGPCVGEMPSFQKLAAERKGKLRIVAVATSEGKAASEAYIKAHPELAFQFAHSLDDSVLKETFKIAGLPTNLLIDGRGKVVDAWLGSRKEEELAKKIDQVLKSKPAAKP
ncbi:TlpA family protein disulfide reductase [Aquisphaera insulae]|uniref:TlpA family protein disulfide reductase n=1 Tax=Aquisphaera insulae TaxID=2712864 RepID=UPI0013EE1C6B|nr:TlpA disulfide reductase family protein [Aquisphaera insulae]